jgi:hypothetical protein
MLSKEDLYTFLMSYMYAAYPAHFLNITALTYV